MLPQKINPWMHWASVTDDSNRVFAPWRCLFFGSFWPSNHFCLIVIEGELSPCRHMNGGCGDLCLLTPYGRVNCSCRGERVLLDDNRCVCKSANPSDHPQDLLLICDGTPHGLDILKKESSSTFICIATPGFSPHSGSDLIWAVYTNLWYISIDSFVHKQESMSICCLFLFD